METSSIGVEDKKPSIAASSKYSLIDEIKTATDFYNESQSNKLGVIDFISRYCEQIIKLDGFEWPENLRFIFLKAYQIMR